VADQVLAVLAAELRQARGQGATFRRAWPAACRQALDGANQFDRSSWHVVLRDTRPAWRRAYTGTPPTPGTTAVIELADLLADETRRRPRGRLVA
jgi:hypothetical protein